MCITWDNIALSKKKKKKLHKKQGMIVLGTLIYILSHHWLSYKPDFGSERPNLRPRRPISRLWEGGMDKRTDGRADGQTARRTDRRKCKRQTILAKRNAAVILLN